MKKWITTLLIVGLFLIISNSGAQVLQVPEAAGNDTLRKAVEYANNTEGVDIIELTTSGGLYITQESSVIKIYKPLTIRAAEGLDEKPVLQNRKTDASTRILFEIMDGGSLILIGLELDGLAGTDTNAKYLIRTDDDAQEGATGISVTNPYTLKVIDCYLHDVVKGSDGNFFRAYKYTFADSVIFRNCIFENSGKEGIRLKEYYDMEGTGFYQADYFEVTNCTFRNTNKEAIVLYAGDNEPFTAGPAIRINHCTFDNCGYNISRIVNAWECDDTEIKNCIMTNSPGNEFGVKLYGATAIIHHCDLYDVGNFKISRSARIGDGMLYEDPLYTDPDNGDFTLDAASPVLGMADDGIAMGDPRWDPQGTGIEPGDQSFVPLEFALHSNYPNPFNAETTISFSLSERMEVCLDILDVRGRFIVRLCRGKKGAGTHTLHWDGRDMYGEAVVTGRYICRLQGNNQQAARAMLLVK
jgi:hypothetical protein